MFTPVVSELQLNARGSVSSFESQVVVSVRLKSSVQNMVMPLGECADRTSLDDTAASKEPLKNLSAVITKSAFLSPAQSHCSTLCPPSPLQLDAESDSSSSEPSDAEEGAFVDDDDDSDPEPEPSLPALAAAFVLPATTPRRSDSDFELRPCGSFLLGKAEAELLRSPEIRRSDSEESSSAPQASLQDEEEPTYTEEWSDFYEKNHEVWFDDDHLVGMEEADEAEEVEASSNPLDLLYGNSLSEDDDDSHFQISTIPDSRSEVAKSQILSTKSRSLESMTCDEDGDVAHEFWVENANSGDMECTKRSMSPSSSGSSTNLTKRRRL